MNIDYHHSIPTMNGILFFAIFIKNKGDTYSNYTRRDKTAKCP